MDSTHYCPGLQVQQARAKDGILSSGKMYSSTPVHSWKEIVHNIGVDEYIDKISDIALSWNEIAFLAIPGDLWKSNTFSVNLYYVGRSGIYDFYNVM